MAKYRFKFKLGEIKISGVELEIDDDREHATAAFAALQSQLAGVVQPVVGKALLGAAAGQVIDATPINSQNGAAGPARKRRKLSSSAPAKSAENGAEPISFVHDPAKFGNPQQGWSTPKKGVWLLWVVEQAAGKTQLAISEIVNTFNQHYRQFGTLTASNLARDFGTLRKKNPPPVGVDTNREPQLWYLHDGGKTWAEQLAKGGDGKAE
jgi:hypothetical protein